MALDYYTFIKSKLKYCNYSKLVITYPEYEESGYFEGANFITPEGIEHPLKFVKHGFATFLEGIIGEDSTRISGEVTFTYNQEEDNIGVYVNCKLYSLESHCENSYEEFR